MDWKKAGLLSAAASVGFGLVGCGVEGPQSSGGTGTPAVLQAGNVAISNDRAALESRVRRSAEPLTVAPKSATNAEVAEKGSEREMGVRLTLVATVQAPSVDGLVVQANDIEIRDHTALVSYNVAGDVFAGAVQMIDFDHPQRPELVSEVLYRHADVNAVTLQGSQVFVGLASDDPALSTPAMVEQLRMTGSRGLEQTGEWLQLPSWAVTDLAVQGDDVVAGVGAQDGGVAVVSRNDLAFRRFTPQFDVRGVAVGNDGVVTVCGGSAPRLMQHSLPALVSRSTSPVSGYSTSFAKGTIEWESNRCYLGTGDAGFQIRNATGQILAQLASSEFADHAGAPGITNAVSVDHHLAFVAAGPAGIQVVRLGRYRCDGRESEETEGLRILGRLTLEEGASCNMVKARNDVLIVAAGLGGVKIVTMEYLN